MENFNFEKIIQMAQEGNRAELITLPPESLVEAIIKLSNRAIHENADRYISKQLESTIIDDYTQKTSIIEKFINTCNDKDQQLDMALQEKVKLQKANVELECALHSALMREANLENRLATMPKAGRPDKYDAEFRARVREYYEDGHTYSETAKHFNISTNTVGRFLK